MAAHGEGATTFARMLYLYRTVNRLSLRDVASQIGITNPTLMRIEHGHLPDVDTWMKVQAWMFARDGKAPRMRAAPPVPTGEEQR